MRVFIFKTALCTLPKILVMPRHSLVTPPVHRSSDRGLKTSKSRTNKEAAFSNPVPAVSLALDLEPVPGSSESLASVDLKRVVDSPFKPPVPKRHDLKPPEDKNTVFAGAYQRREMMDLVSPAEFHNHLPVPKSPTCKDTLNVFDMHASHKPIAHSHHEESEENKTSLKVGQKKISSLQRNRPPLYGPNPRGRVPAGAHPRRETAPNFHDHESYGNEVKVHSDARAASPSEIERVKIDEENNHYILHPGSRAADLEDLALTKQRHHLLRAAGTAGRDWGTERFLPPDEAFAAVDHPHRKNVLTIGTRTKGSGGLKSNYTERIRIFFSLTIVMNIFWIKLDLKLLSMDEICLKMFVCNPKLRYEK